MNTLGSFSVDVRAGTASLQSDLGRANHMAMKAAQDMQRSFSSLSDNVRGEMEKAGKSVESATKLVKGYVAAVASVQTVRGLAGMADTWSDLNSRVQQSVGVNSDASAVMQRLSQVARQTYSNLELTSEGFSKNSSTLNALGKSTLQQLDYTQSLNNALVVSGAKQERAVMVQDSLAKAMAEGALRGGELSNVLNYGSRVAELLANELGVSVVQLRGLGAEGKITSDVIFNSLVKNMETLTAEAEAMPATLGDAFTLLQNATLSLVGMTDQAAGSSAWLADTIITIADAVEILTPHLVQLVELWKSQDDEQKAVSFSAQEVAQAMKTVVTGLILAKNAVDVLVDGFRFMVGIGVAAAAEIIEAFSDVAELPGIVSKMLSPATMTQGAGELLALVNRNQEAVGRFTSEAARLAEEFGRDLDTNIQDVANALIAFEGSAKAATGAIDGNTRAVVANAVSAKDLAKQQRLAAIEAKANADLAEMLARALDAQAAALGPVEKAHADYERAVRAANAQVAELIKKGADKKAADEALAATELMLAAARDREIKSAEIQIRNRERAQQTANRMVQEMQTELGLLRMNETARRSAVVALDAELAMRQAIQQAQDAGWDYKGDTEALVEQAKEMALLIENARELDQILSHFESPFERMARDVGLLRAELARVSDPMSEAFDPERVRQIQRAIGEVNHAIGSEMVGSMQEGLRSLQSMTSNGSKAFAAFQVAIDALSVAQAISAVLNQGQGDPYTAFARMAAMAAAVAQLVGNIGANFGGSNGFTDTAAERQARQGTGTVLGDLGAKSESIINATQITADATSELVGINRGMLRALTALQGGLDRAGGMLARGAGQVGFDQVGGSLEFRDTAIGGVLRATSIALMGPIGGWLDNLLGGLLGGSSRITDEGILLGGGSLSDIGAQAYQEQQYRRWRFGSWRTSEQTGDLPEGVASQFQLVIDSIVETVRQGALALGMVPSEVQAAIDAFRAEEIRISLKDLTASEQQQELLAVFSSIFDNLAGSVVPFVEQFQRVGEGLGETLVRVATGVQVTQEGLRRLGFSLDELDPERFAQISESLIEAVGGLEEFISGMQSFVDKFAPEAHRFELLQSDITRAFEQYGLTIPATRDGMWALMQSMDAATEAGREQIATLLRLTATADAYYTMLERAEQERVAVFDAEAAMGYAEMVGSINRQLAELGGMSAFQTSLRDIATQYRTNVERLNELARAAGLAGAREEDLARALQLSTMQRLKAIAALEAEGRALVESLGFGPLGMIDAEIEALAALEAQATSALGSFSSAMGEVAQAASDAVNLLLGDLSPLRDSQKLAVALDALRAGQIGQEDVLRIGRRLYASGADYRRLFDEVMQIGDRRNLGGDLGGMGSVGNVGQQVSQAMQELLDRRAEIEAQQRAGQRFLEAGQLAQIIADLAGARGEDFESVAQSLGLTGLDQLLTDLQLDNVQSLTDYLTALQADSYTLADLAATITAGEQLIVDTLRDIFDAQHLADAIAKPLWEGQRDGQFGSLPRPFVEPTAALEEIPSRIDDAIAPVREELAALREQTREMLDRMTEIAANTGATAQATQSTAQTAANTALIETTIAPRSRIGLGGLESTAPLF